MGELVIVTGPPGAGKTTVCELLAASFSSSVLVAGDWFFGRWRRGAIAPWLPEAQPQAAVAGEAAAATAGIFARADCWVVYDGVVRPRELPHFAAAARARGGLHYAVLLPDVATCVRRLSEREGHGFTSEDATRTMHRDFTDPALPARHVIPEAQQPPAELAAQLLARLTAGRLRAPED